MPVPKVWATPPKYAPRDAFPAVAEACGRIQELDEAKRGFESPNLTWLPPRTRAALRFGTGRGGCNDVQRERVRACVAFGTDARACSVVPSVPSFKGSAPHSPHGLLASGRAASAARLGCSEQRGSTSPRRRGHPLRVDLLPTSQIRDVDGASCAPTEAWFHNYMLFLTTKMT